MQGKCLPLMLCGRTRIKNEGEESLSAICCNSNTQTHFAVPARQLNSRGLCPDVSVGQKMETLH